jgi:uncharacterized surface protein with fasciclin (FAS1) repeats
MNKTYRNRLAALTLTLAVAVGATGAATAGSSPAASPRQAEANIVQTAVQAGSFKTLVSLVKRAGLAKTLAGPGPYTVLAPTDAAFKKVPKKTLKALLANKALLRKVLLYHVIAGEVRAEQVVTLKRAQTVAKQPIRISVRGGKVFLNGKTRVTATDVEATNGVIHVLNGVLIPPK